MEVYSVMDDIKNKTLRSFYIFSGEEWKVQQIYIEQIAKAKNLRIKRINSINDIYNQLQNKSLLSSKFCFVALYDDVLIRNEQLWSQVRNEKMLGEHIYIIQLPTIDKRTKFYKEFSVDICEFKPLEPKILQKYIKKEIDLSAKNAKRLMEVCEHDYGRCLLEIDKIKQFGVGTFSEVGNEKDGWDADRAFEVLLEDGTIYQPPKDAIFEFADAVMRHEVNRAFDLLDHCHKINEAVMVMLSVLFSSAKNILQVQTSASVDTVGATGLSPWEIKLAKEKTGYYDDDYLAHMLRQIQKVEVGIKQGKIEEDIAMEYLLAVIL